MLANCSLTKLILASLKNKGDCDRSIFAERLIQQEYVNTLNCEDKIDEICYHEPICDNLKKFNCEMYFTNLEYTQTLTGLQVKVDAGDIFLGKAPYTYEWAFDESLFDLEVGSSNTDPILIIKWIVAPLTTATITCKVTDANGCSFSLTKTITRCNDCLDIDYTVTFDSLACWTKTINKYRLPLSLNINCINGDQFINQATNLNLTSPNITIVEDAGNWFLEIDDYDLYKNEYCHTGNSSKCLYSLNDGKVYSYNILTNTSNLLFTIPPLSAQFDDIAYSNNKFFALHNRQITRYDVDWGLNTLSNPTTYTHPFANPHLNVLHVGLCAINDNQVLVATQFSIQGSGIASNSIQMVDVSTLSMSMIVSPSTYGQYANLDLLIQGDVIYSLDEGVSGVVVRKFSYSTGLLLSQSSILPYTASRAEGMYMKDNDLYIFYGDGHLQLLNNFTYILGITKTISIPNSTSIYGAAEIDVPIEISDKLSFRLDYTYCSNNLFKTYETDAPCSNEICCSECTMTMNIVGAKDCFIPYILSGKNGNLLEVDIAISGCAGHEIIASNFALINNVDPTKTTSLIFLNDKYYVFTELQDWTDIDFGYSYESCGVQKLVSGNISETITTYCCESCISRDTFEVSIGTCISRDVTAWCIGANIVFSCPDDVIVLNVDAADVYYNGIPIGTFQPNDPNGKMCIFNTVPYESICGKTLQAKITAKICQDEEYFTKDFVIPCGLQECIACVPCNSPETSAVDLNLNELCFNEVSSNLYSARLFPFINCGGNYSTNVKSISILTNTTGCSFTVALNNKQWYLQATNCILAPISGILTLKICWDNC